jgi:hypothetical protein
MAYVRCTSKTHKRLKIIAAKLGVSMQELVDRATASYLAGHSEHRADVGAQSKAGELRSAESVTIPVEMHGLVAWLLDLFSREGTLEQELLKQTLRELGGKRTALTHPKKNKKAS